MQLTYLVLWFGQNFINRLLSILQYLITRGNTIRIFLSKLPNQNIYICLHLLLHIHNDAIYTCKYLIHYMF